jgi:hypothetical protein
VGGWKDNSAHWVLLRISLGIDSFEGQFTSHDGEVIISHDIGWLAGAYASRDKSAYFEETVTDGARVWFGKQDWPDGKGGRTRLKAVTLPDSGCANVFLKFL